MTRFAPALALAVFFAASQPARLSEPARSAIVVVVDGLRPDFVTPATMPRLSRLAQRGTTFTAHHSVFPTVTRVNGASLVTGSYPETHGLLGNTIYIPRVDAARGLDTGRRENLERVAAAEGHLLTAPDLAEILKPAGKTVVALGSGTPGAVFVLNNTTATGALVHPEYTVPPTLQPRILERFGSVPANALPNTARHRRVVDVFLQMIVAELHPDVAVIWLNDPDDTAHARGINAAETQQSLAIVDAEIGRIEDGLRASGRLDRTDIVVASDHGFSTYTNALRLASLVEPFAKRLADGSADIVVAEGAIYFRGDRDRARTASVVAALQKRPEVGAIFTRPRGGRGAEGDVGGTLSFDVVHWNHPRSGDILVSANWNDEANGAGTKGTSTQAGVAGHGSSSPYDIHNVLFAAGPDFREHAVSNVPTANVDIAPTLLHLLGLPVPKTMTGRVIEEGLRNGPLPSSVRITRETQTVKTPDASYELRAHISSAAGKRYLDSTEVVRK